MSTIAAGSTVTLKWPITFFDREGDPERHYAKGTRVKLVLVEEGGDFTTFLADLGAGIPDELERDDFVVDGEETA